MEGLISRRLEDVRLAVLMLDGVELKGRTNVVALGITTDGVKIPLGLREGSTENAAVATALLSALVDRGLDVGQGVLCVLDSAKALRKAVGDVLGVNTPVQRCIRDKERNALEHLPERDRPAVKQRLRSAWHLDDHAAALERLRALAARDPRQPEGDARLDQPVRVDDRVRPPHQPQRQTLAIGRNGPPLDRRRHARSRTPILQVVGYRDLAKLAVAIERDLAGTTTQSPTQEPTILVNADRQTGTAVAKLHDERDILALSPLDRHGKAPAKVA